MGCVLFLGRNTFGMEQMVNFDSATAVLKRLNIVLACATAIAVVAAIAAYATYSDGGVDLKNEDVLSSGVGVASEYVMKDAAYLINPGCELVVFTNYACPYCAEFYEKTQGLDYSTCILLLDKDSDRFATERIVSPYMLKLSRYDEILFSDLEAQLFSAQEDWVMMDEDEILAYMNGVTGLDWTKDDLDAELRECEVAVEEEPDDLEFVPALYSNGMKYDQFVLDLVG